MSFLNDQLMANLHQEFDTLEFDYREIELGGVIPIFFVKVPNTDILTKKWKAISEFIAVYFQSKLTSEFSLWNLYLMFISESEVNIEIKYQIENDTFSSRKLVISPIREIDDILKEYVLNANLLIQPTDKVTEVKLETNPIIWDQLGKISSKQKMTEDHIQSLEKIINQIKLQDHEI